MNEEILTEQEDDESTEPFVVGLDIGYGNVKMSYGYAAGKKSPDEQKVTTKVFPATFQKFSAGSAPFYPIRGKEKFVSYEGSNYLVFAAESQRLPTFEDDRCLDKLYPKTEQYMALFLGSLLEIGRKEIDLLVIGLPVNQFNDPKNVELIKSRLTGKFRPSPKGIEVTVKRVEVIRQPIGAFFNSVANGVVKANQSTLFCDIGFFSTDWVLMMSRSIQISASGSVLNAVSNIIEQVAFDVGNEQGNTFATTAFEDVIREGKNTIKTSTDKEIDFSGVLKAYSDKAAETVVRKIYRSVRNYIDRVENVVIVGGGAAYFEDAFREIFSEQKVIREENSVTANASGFYWYGTYLIVNSN